MTLAEKGKWEEALRAYKKASSIDPTIPNPYHNSGMIYKGIGQTQKAKEQFQKALSVDSTFIFSQIELEKLHK